MVVCKQPQVCGTSCGVSYDVFCLSYGVYCTWVPNACPSAPCVWELCTPVWACGAHACAHDAQLDVWACSGEGQILGRGQTLDQAQIQGRIVDTEVHAAFLVSMVQKYVEDGKTEVDDEVEWGDRKILSERTLVLVKEEACMKVLKWGHRKLVVATLRTFEVGDGMDHNEVWLVSWNKFRDQMGQHTYLNKRSLRHHLNNLR